MSFARSNQKTYLILVVLIFLCLIVGPFLIPVPPLNNTVPPEQLADNDSQFIDVDSITIHYKLIKGISAESFLLLHGFGASTFSWREVMKPLSEFGTVAAFDRPAFGLTERPLSGDWEGESPYSLKSQVNITIGLMDELRLQRSVLVGNSAGGTVAMMTALAYPDRVSALILVDPAVYERNSPNWSKWLLNTPQMHHLGPLFVRNIQDWGIDFAQTAWHDPDKITPEIWAGYLMPLQADNWDRGLWELTAAREPSGLPDRLHELTLPILVITGDDDRIVPTEDTIRLAQELPNATLVVLNDCGHVPHEECPNEFMEAVTDFLSGLH